VPNGVLPGGQFQAQTPSGAMMVTCPPTSKAGDQIQIMVSAPAVTAVVAPTMMMPAAPSACPAARDMAGAVREVQGSTCTLPTAVRKKTHGSNFPANPDSLQPNFGTGSPDVEHAFMAPSSTGIVAESDFVGASMLAGATGPDPFEGLLTGGVEMALDSDVDSRVAEAVGNMKKNAAAYTACLIGCLPCSICIIGAKANKPGGCEAGCGENEATARLRTAAGARKLTLTSDAIVYECRAHTATVIKNYTAFDQYGHRYPAAAAQSVNVPATKLSIPLRRTEVVVVPASSVGIAPMFSDEMFVSCCGYQANGSVVAVRVGDGLKTVVACVEVGVGSNALAFADRCNTAAKSAPEESPHIAAAYNAWLLGRLRQTGTMTGGRPSGPSGPTGMTMERALPFMKMVGPLPAELNVKKGGWFSRARLDALSGLEISKATGQIYHPRSSAFVSQLNTGDRVLSINGVSLTGPADDTFFDNVLATGRQLPPNQPRFMQMCSSMPYFQPNYLVTVSLPPGSGIDALGLEYGGNTSGKPPKLRADGGVVSPLAQSLGCQPGDVIVQANVDGALHDTTKMSGEELLAVASGAMVVQLTLLQPSLTADPNHQITWPMGVPRTV